MNIGIVGIGALGSLIGFQLSGADADQVWMLGSWPDHIAAIQRHGLACEHNGNVAIRRVNITDTPAQIGACDIVLILVKANQTLRAAEQARTLCHSTTLVITLQNGVGNREILATTLGDERVVQGVTRLGATMLAPGRVRFAGIGPTFFAATDGQRTRLEDLIKRFQAAGLPSEPRTDVEQLVWSKLVVNAGINALTAVLRIPNGELVARPPARELVAALVREAAAVAAARGTSLSGDPVEQTLAVAEATATNYSSTLQDVLRGQPTEISAINGAIVREGARLGIPTPCNRFINDLFGALDYRR